MVTFDRLMDYGVACMVSKGPKGPEDKGGWLLKARHIGVTRALNSSGDHKFCSVML